MIGLYVFICTERFVFGIVTLAVIM